MFLDAADDPRENGPRMVDEKSTLVEYLRVYRLTLEIKCQGLDAEQLARRSVEPSTMSLLGLIRHMADVERSWFKRVMSGQSDLPRIYSDENNRDGDFDDVVADPAMVEDAWTRWREEVAYAEQLVADATDLGMTGKHPVYGDFSLREVLVHMIEEYARHMGHADLLRERIDGRVGQ